MYQYNLSFILNQNYIQSSAETTSSASNCRNINCLFKNTLEWTKNLYISCPRIAHPRYMTSRINMSDFNKCYNKIGQQITT